MYDAYRQQPAQLPPSSNGEEKMTEFIEIMKMVGMIKPLHVRRLQKALREWGANPGKVYFSLLFFVLFFSILCGFLSLDLFSLMNFSYS